MDLSDKIRNARKKQGLTQVQLAEKLGVTQGTINQYETKAGEVDNKGKPKKTAKPSLEKIPELAEALDMDISEFFENSETLKKVIVKKELKNNFAKYSDLIPDENQLKNVVFLSKSEMRIGAGSEGVYDLAMLQNEERKVVVDRAFLKGLKPQNLRIFEVVGDSMEPDFFEGDWAIADMVAGRGDFVRIAGVYIVRVDDVVYIKRVEFLPQNKIKLISLNPKYSDMYPHKEGYECEILGKVCGKVHCEVYKGLTFEDYGIK